MKNLALVAEAVLEDLGGKKLWIKRIFYEYGYDGIRDPLMCQLQHFAAFYGFVLGALDLGKMR